MLCLTRDRGPSRQRDGAAGPGELRRVLALLFKPVLTLGRCSDLASSPQSLKYSRLRLVTDSSFCQAVCSLNRLCEPRADACGASWGPLATQGGGEEALSLGEPAPRRRDRRCPPLLSYPLSRVDHEASPVCGLDFTTFLAPTAESGHREELRRGPGNQVGRGFAQA